MIPFFLRCVDLSPETGEFKTPDIEPFFAGGTLLVPLPGADGAGSWMVKPGDSVERGQPLAAPPQNIVVCAPRPGMFHSIFLYSNHTRGIVLSTSAALSVIIVNNNIQFILFHLRQ